MTAPETEKPLSPLHPKWAERHADECDFIIVSPIDVVAHAKSEDEIVSDYIRLDKPYLSLKVYRKTTPEAVAESPGKGPWVAVEGLNHVSMRADDAADTVHWFLIFSKSSEKKLRLYECINVAIKLQEIYDELTAEAEAKLRHERERKDAIDGAAVLRAIRCGAQSVEEISEDSPLSFSRIEALVNRLVIQGKIESVDFQPPVVKVLRIKGA